jgi:hypothetical protein
MSHRRVHSDDRHLAALLAAVHTTDDSSSGLGPTSRLGGLDDNLSSTVSGAKKKTPDHLDFDMLDDDDDFKLPGDDYNRKTPAGTYTTDLLGSVGDGTIGFSDTKASGTGSGTGRFRIVCLPSEESGFNRICRCLIGQGGTFCIKSACKTTHRGGSAQIFPGAIHVLNRVGDAAYLEPFVLKSKLDNEVLSQWENTRCSLDEWTLKFTIANTINGVVSLTDLEAGETVKNVIKNTKTPLKAERNENVEKDGITYFQASPYKRKIDNVEGFLNRDSSLSDLKELAIHMDDGIHTLSSFYVDLSGDITVMEKKLEKSSRDNSSRVDDIEGRLGKRPKMDPKFQAPTLWGSVSLLADITDDTRFTLSNTLPKLEKVNKEFIDRVASEWEDKKQSIDDRVTRLRESLITTYMSLDEKMKNSHVNLLELSQRFNELKRYCRMFPRTGDSNPDQSIDSIAQEVKILQSKVSKLLTESDSEAIKFCSLGFRKTGDAKVWRESHLQDRSFGLVVDVHMVLEHIYASVFPSDSDRTHGDLTSLVKIQVYSMLDGIALRSFQHRIPKYFSKSTRSHSIIKDNESYLDAFPSFERWTDATTGGRVHLKEALESFRMCHQSIIDEHLDHTTRAYQVASTACTLSVAWIEDLITFMDELQRELTKSRFSSANAWHLVTRQAHRIFLELSGPRMSVNVQFEAGKTSTNANLMFWAVCRSHDIMARYKQHSFKNDQTVAAEYVKFLITHSGNDAVDKLSTKVATLVEDLTKLSKLGASQTIISNKLDEQKKLINELTKKVTKLESGR